MTNGSLVLEVLSLFHLVPVDDDFHRVFTNATLPAWALPGCPDETG